MTSAWITGTHRKWVFSVLAAYFLFKKLRALMRPRHSYTYSSPPPLKPDPALFPQYFAGRDGMWLHTRQWVTPAPRALVFVSHGFAEHSGRYEHVARELVKALGVNVYAMDHEGHGLSQVPLLSCPLYPASLALL